MVKIIITPKTPEGEIGLKNYISDNLELTDLSKGIGVFKNIGRIKGILRRWGINYSTYVGTKRITERYSSQDGTLNPVVLTIELFDGQCDRSTSGKYLRDIFKVFKKCYNIDESDLNVSEE